MHVWKGHNETHLKTVRKIKKGAGGKGTRKRNRGVNAIKVY
jgi:hypothetical protein